jgi:uncharacterized damage-inducible protein DinB
MFHRLQDFFDVWNNESSNTRKVLESLTDASLSQAVAPGGRTLGRLANHIIETLTEMPHKLNLGIEEEKPDYHTVAALVAHYQRCDGQFQIAIETHWTDASLEKESNMYGQLWKNGLSLWVILVHMIHHRAQMTVLMRQAGLAVPGLYGPAKEEWVAMGMPPME